MPRVEIPFIGPFATNRERPLSSQISRNMWAEINPEARNQVSMHNMAGTRIFATLEGTDRGMHEFNNLMYAVNGDNLYSIDADGVGLILGSIGGTGRCVMANDQSQLIITTGATPYRYTVAGGVEAITDPDLVNPTCVAYLNSQFLFDNNDGTWGEFVTTSDDAGIAIDSLDFANAESHPDDLIRIIAFRQFAWMFGSHSVEPWQNTGTSNPPWARVSSGVQPYGVAGTHAVVTTTEHIYFLDHKRIPRRSNGLNFENIGTPPIGVEFAKYSKIDDCIVYEFTQDNQQFVVFTFPTANRTWCFHEQSGSWSQLSHGVDDDRHRASSMVNVYGLNYCADHTSGLIYEYSLDIYSDNDGPIIKERSTATIHGGLYGAPGKRLWFDEVEFIIVGGETAVEGTGLGPQPIVVSGICGNVDDLTRGQLLNVSPLSLIGGAPSAVEEENPTANGVSFADSKDFGFTCALMREAAPLATYEVGAFEFGSAGTQYFSFYMDENGYMNIVGLNDAGTEILNVQIKNNGGSFADSAIHMFAVVMDLSDESKREIWVDALKVDQAAAWVTWNTYTDDFLHFEDSIAAGQKYQFGQGKDGIWGKTDPNTNSQGPDAGIDCLGYISFDDTCSLIPGSVWDTQCYVTDPQAWEGWYLVQPAVFFGPSFWKNTGTTAPTYYQENKMELDWDLLTGNSYDSGTPKSGKPIAAGVLNAGIAGITDAIYTGDSGTLPPAPPPDPQTEIVAPFWQNTGNWIDLSNLTNTTFEAQFGVVVEGAAFDSVFAVETAALVNTSDSGNRMRIEDSSDCTNGAMYITDASGNVVDTMIYSGVPSGDSVLIPTGANYYVVISSDTTNAQIKKWDQDQVDISGSVTWESYFGSPFELGKFFGNITKKIPLEGLSIRFEIPITSSSYKVALTMFEVPSNPGIRIGAVNQTVLDFTSGATYTWGLGGGIDCGVNLSGQDIDLLPGNTYFFNVKHTDPQVSNNYVTIQASTLAA